MSMACGARVVTTIELADLRKLFPKQTAAFEEALLEAKGMSLDLFCRALDYKQDGCDPYDHLDDLDPDQNIDPVFAAWEKLAAAFWKEHRPLTLYAYVGEQAMRMYDPIEGGVIAVAGVYEMIPAAKAIKEHLNDKGDIWFG